MLNTLRKYLSYTPLASAAKVILVILGGEFLIMVAIEGVFTPLFGKQVPALFWEFLDPVLLSLIVAPALHILVWRPMRDQQLLLEKQRDELRIAAVAFNVQDGVLITDPKHNILKINQSFTDITGYSSNEVLGKTPLILQSGVQDKEFYAVLKETLEREGYWKGEIWNRRKNGDIYPEFLTITSLKDAESKIINYVGTFHDITERKAVEDEIKYLAFYDPLTGLANRRLMTDRMEQILSLARRTGELVAVCMIDLDGFKLVNDQKGHEAGDQLLKEVAKRIQECIRHSDTASRFGGDEFALILGGFSEIGECMQSLARIISALSEPYMVVNEVARVTASIGATIFPNDGSSPDQLLRHADESMYEAKNAGKNCYRLFNPSYQNQQEANQATLKKIENALAQGQIILYYQPQVDCRRGIVTGAEALIRWNHPILGLLPPSDFLPLVEHNDLIITIGEWLIKQALTQLIEWQSQGLALTISINISARHLHQINFIDRLKILLAGNDQKLIGQLEIEVVETAVLEDINVIADTIRKCREMGVRIAIDDFGTGFSSLAHLKKIPFDVIKIDKSFVLGMLINPEDLVLVNSVIGLAASFKRKVVAEGVESIDHLLMLLELGCNQIQGFEIARPMPADQIESWLKHFQPNPLWQLGSAQLPSRDYFEMLLAEVNHRHWIGQLVDELSDSRSAINPELQLDHRQCRLGHWYYGDGSRQFGNESWFMLLEPLHKQIHQTAVRLCKHKRSGNLAEIEVDEAILKSQQGELESHLKNLREALADRYLSTRSINQKGETV